MFFFNVQAVSDQRLIYSGHLLKDEKTLKEIFQPTEQDNSTFTVHLVFSQKNQKTETKAKEPRTAGNESTSSNQSIPNLTNVNISQFSFNLTNDPSTDFASLYVQQMQQYQQMYVNYMTQFLNHQNNNLDQPQQSNNVYNTATSLPMINPMLFNSLLTVPNLTDFSTLVNGNLNNNSNNSTNTADNGGPVGQPADNATANENQAQNNNDNQNEVDGVPNNGLLDMINIFWNILILLSLISASFSRTIFVLSVGFLYYLYQSGFFSLLRIRIFGDYFIPNVNNNHNDLPINEEQLQQMMDDLDRRAPPRRRIVDSNRSADNTDINNNQPEQNFMINKFRFCWMVISSLFSSLMPHNGPMIPAN